MDYYRQLPQNYREQLVYDGDVACIFGELPTPLTNVIDKIYNDADNIISQIENTSDLGDNVTANNLKELLNNFKTDQQQKLDNVLSSIDNFLDEVIIID